MSKRLFATMLAILALLATGLMAETAKSTTKAKKTATAAEETKAPRLTLVEPVKDFGTVPKGEKLSWVFEVKNTGTSDLEIIAARPACGCTVAEFDKIIKPGQTGRVHANVDTAAFAGPIAKAVTLETNDPATPTAQVTIHAVVKPFVEAYPAGFVRYNMIQGDAESQIVTLFSEEEEPFQIVKIEAPQEWIKVEAKKIEDEKLRATGGRKDQNQYALKVTVGGPDAKTGPLAEKIHIMTNSKHQPDYFISVTGVIRPPYRVEPMGVNFGEVAPTDAAATRTVLLRSNDLKTPETFVVTKAETNLPGVTAAVKPTANKGEYEVTLQIANTAKPGDLDGNVTIHTSDRVKPTVVVPVKGTVKARAVAAGTASK